MKSHHLLSPQEYLFLTSQDKISNPSELRSRIADKVQQSFKTFDIILHSKRIDQKYVDKIFPEITITWFLKNLTYYGSKRAAELEENKIHIAEQMIKWGLFYYQMRFKRLRFFEKRFEEFEDLLLEYKNFISEQVQYSEESKKKKRKKVVKTNSKA